MKRIWIMSLMIATIIIADQLTKGTVQSTMVLGQSIEVVSGYFNITYVRNPGAAFGMGAGASDWVRMILFKIIPVFACIWLLVMAWKERYGSLRLCLVYSLIFAGAVGNLIDRFTLDYVVDFLDFHWQGSHFPAFNIADAAISIAAGLYILDFILVLKNGPETEDQLKS